MFRGACKRGADADLVPIIVQIQEGDTPPQPFTLWAKLLPRGRWSTGSGKSKQVLFLSKRAKASWILLLLPLPFRIPRIHRRICTGRQQSTPAGGKAAENHDPPDAKGIDFANPAEGWGLSLSFFPCKVAVAPHPHELRARMIDHLQRHTDRYQAQWEAAGKIEQPPSSETLNRAALGWQPV